MTARKFLVGVAVKTAVALLVLAMLVGGWLLVERARIAAATAKIRAANMPMTPEEIFRPSVSPVDNAAPLLDKAAGQLKALKKDGFTVWLIGSGKDGGDPFLFSEQELEEVKRQMAAPEARALLDLLREASAKPGCQIDRDYSKANRVEVGGIKVIFEGARVLGLSAWLRARAGDAAGAFDDLIASSRLAGKGLADPFYLGWLLGMGSDEIGVNLTGKILGAIPPERLPLDLLRQLGHLWTTHADGARVNFVQTLDLERVTMLMGSHQGLYEEKGLPLLLMASIDQRAWLEFILSRRDRILTMAPGSLPADDKDLLENLPHLAPLARVLFRDWTLRRQRLDLYQVTLQVAQVGLALEEWRASHDYYPAALEDLGLAPRLLRNPFSGHPLVYQRSPEGVKVCSVGKDRADNGGIRWQKDQPGDVVWSVQRSAP